MLEKRIYLSPPHMSGQELELIKEVFDSNWIAPLGPMVDRFESEMIAFTGTGAALATNSATAAIHLALILCGVKKGDLVFCSSFTFIGSANPILYTGAEPIFIDSEPDTWNMSPSALQRAFADCARNGILPRAVLVVNLYGQSANYEQIIDICNNYGVPVIEDAAESLGAEYKGQASGTLGDYGVFSFNGNKIITTSGGGMLISRNSQAMQKARYFATQAREPLPWYEHTEIGYNYRMSNLLAAVGCAQLAVLKQRIESKRFINAYYRSQLEQIDGIDFMPSDQDGISNQWLTVITIDDCIIGKNPVEIVRKMELFNIETRQVWKPMHLQPVFNGCKYYAHDDKLSHSDTCFKTGMCLPSGSSMEKSELDRVCQCLIRILSA